jgi:5-methylcytosine-specific restriction endonuclease McrA
MPQHVKPTPAKHCQWCGTQLDRKLFNGRLESMNVFLRRKYCDLTCMGLAHRTTSPTLGTLRSRAKKLRGPLCGRCGANDNLSVHHLDGNPANNTLENVMTMCMKCHTTWHWEHGKKALPATRRPTCSVCGIADATKDGLCQLHYQRMKKYGDPLLTKIKGKGGTYEITRVSPTHSVRRYGPHGQDRRSIRGNPRD